MPHASCGLVHHLVQDLSTTLSLSNAAGFDFIVVPLSHPRYRLPPLSASSLPMGQLEGGSSTGAPIRRSYAFARSDMLLKSTDWSSLVVGSLPRELQMESTCTRVRRESEERLQRELNYAAHLGLSAILVELKRPQNTNLARALYSFILKSSGSGPQVWVRVPIITPKSECAPEESEDSISSWDWWNNLRTSANFAKKLGLVLELDSQLVSTLTDEIVLKRWLGEPIKALVLNTSSFLTNKKGYPVLPKALQAIVRQFIPSDVQVLIEGRNRGHDMSLYQSYMDHLWQQTDSGDPLRQFAKGYEDFLQSPLQPLMDNLESGTYEVFEQDPVKYTEYQRAMFEAIKDKIPEGEKATKTITLMVLGAGRGPLVRAALKAALAAERKIRVFAVEKNPNAIVTLLTQKEEDWGDQVEVISSDMRQWHPEEHDKADIIVSELLGSFGDNELSPECLYNAQHLFKSDAVSIPTSYTSWVGPLQSSKLYNEVRGTMDVDKISGSNFETPYVVHLQNKTELAPPQPLFTFVHPLSGNIDNNRYEIKSFDITMDAVLHGFGGYFECVLYKDVMISINPPTHSKGMFSWFPIFFPLRTPVRLTKGQALDLNFWRFNNGKHVWYEWCITKPVAQPVLNPNGRSYTIGL